MEIRLEKICKNYKATNILDDVSFSIEKEQKIGLVGNNGTGKSTLLKIIAGIIEPDEGKIISREGLVVSYMPQEISLFSEEKVYAYLRSVSGIEKIEKDMEKSLEALAEYERRDGYTFDYRANTILSGFGLSEKGDCKINELSSGQKSKVFLIGVLLSDPDVLLLDEPTNNLDLPALIWLENFILQSDSSLVVVSHDRFFLDRVVSKILELDQTTKKITIARGKYSDYLERKKKEDNRNVEDYEKQQEEIKRLKEEVRARKVKSDQGSRFSGDDKDKFQRGYKRDRAGKSGKAAKSIEKRIDQMKTIDQPIKRDVFRIFLDHSKPEGGKTISLENTIFGYPERNFKIGPFSLEIPYASRIVILGLNGTGKSTFLKGVSGKVKPIDGKIDIGSSLVLGNLMQEHENLPREETIFTFLEKRGHLEKQEVYHSLARYGFQPEDGEKKISSLSPGERARILFALFSALSVNVLLLDEPTNHLDIEALEAVEEAVSAYKGTIVLISHDRYFLQRFSATDVFVLSNGKLNRQQSFENYLEQSEKKAKRLLNII
jgi:ATP-binding cassette, subfamily F, member 3